MASGLIVDWAGLLVLFGISAVAYIVAFGLSLTSNSPALVGLTRLKPHLLGAGVLISSASSVRGTLTPEGAAKVSLQRQGVPLVGSVGALCRP